MKNNDGILIGLVLFVIVCVLLIAFNEMYFLELWNR